MHSTCLARCSWSFVPTHFWLKRNWHFFSCWLGSCRTLMICVSAMSPPRITWLKPAHGQSFCDRIIVRFVIGLWICYVRGLIISKTYNFCPTWKKVSISMSYFEHLLIFLHLLVIIRFVIGLWICYGRGPNHIKTYKFWGIMTIVPFVIIHYSDL